MAGKNIKDADRVQVGKTKDGKYHIWHKIMGENSSPKYVDKEEVVDVIDDLLEQFQNSKQD